jgi:hypothetical protein
MHTVSSETYVNLRKLLHVPAQIRHPQEVTKTEEYNHRHHIVILGLSYCSCYFHLPDIPRTVGDKVAKMYVEYSQPVNKHRKTLAAFTRNMSSLSGGRQQTLTSKMLA